ncbi:hypothetical protein ACKAV7_014601 [Fusarium commune]
MRTSALIGMGYALFASGALAGCHGGGAKFDTYKDAVKEKIDLFCQRPLFKGKIPGHHTEKKCYDIGPNKSVNIRFENQAPVDGHADPDYCKLLLGAEVDGCDHGGESTFDNWTSFKRKVDPNNQKCPSPQV